MELRRLRYFVAVAEEGGFGRAARKLHIAQPPLSNQIKRLEEEMGVTLFERTGRGVRLTEAGKFLLEELHDVLSRLDQTVSITKRVGHGEVGRLILGFVPSASNEVLPPILRSFTERFPDVELSLREMRPDRILQKLHAKELDAGVLHLPLSDDELHVEVISRESLVLALPEDHHLASEPQVDLRTVSEEPFILPARYQMIGLYGQVVRACKQVGFVPDAIHKDVWAVATIVGLVAGGMGIALLPASTMNLRRKGVVYKWVPDLSPTLELGVVSRKGETSAVVNAFRDVAKEKMRNGNAETGTSEL